MPYTILIPIHNEVDSISILLGKLEQYAYDNEILIVDDEQINDSLTKAGRENYFFHYNNWGR